MAKMNDNSRSDNMTRAEKLLVLFHNIAAPAHTFMIPRNFDPNTRNQFFFCMISPLLTIFLFTVLNKSLKEDRQVSEFGTSKTSVRKTIHRITKILRFKIWGFCLQAS